MSGEALLTKEFLKSPDAVAWARSMNPEAHRAMMKRNHHIEMLRLICEADVPMDEAVEEMKRIGDELRGNISRVILEGEDKA